MRGVAGIEPEYTYTLLGMILGGIGWAIKRLWESWKEARDGRKDEAQRIAAERDKAKSEVRALKDELHRVRVEADEELRKKYIKNMKLREVIYATRQVAIDKGHVSQSDLPPIPEDKE